MKRIVLADADILIDLVKLNFLKLLKQLSKYYNWEISITESIKSECKDQITLSLVNSMIKTGNIKIINESSMEVAKIIEELDKIMVPGKEIELFAIAKHRNYDILTDDLENTGVYYRNYPLDKGKFWIYNLYQLLYLACKARILTIEEVNDALLNLHKNGIRFLNKFILKRGFKAYCEEIDKFRDRHISPRDAEKFMD